MTGTRKRFRDRAQARFERALHDMEGALDAMISEHAAKGRLQSGATIVASLKIFEEHAKDSLDQTLTEAGKLIEHRGWKWRAAMQGIGEAVSQHTQRAREHLARPIELGDRAKTPSIAQAIDERVTAISKRLVFQLADFRDGWTAPIPKLWKDRNPFLYAVVLFVAGATIGAFITAFAGKLSGTIVAP